MCTSDAILLCYLQFIVEVFEPLVKVIWIATSGISSIKLLPERGI